MSKVFMIKDTGDALNKIFTDIAQLKQQVTAPTVMGNTTDTYEEIFIGPEGGPYDVLSRHISPVEPGDGQGPSEPLILVPGAYLDDVFVDAEWNAPADGSASEYEIEMSKETAPNVFSLAEIQRTGSTSIRFRSLEPEQSYGFRVRAINRIGVRSSSVPAEPQTVQTTKDTSVPPGPQNVIIARGATTVVVKFDPITRAEAPDVADGNGTYQVQVDTVNTFGSGALRSLYATASIVSFSDVIVEDGWYARVRAIDGSGNVGPWSVVAGPSTAGGVVDEMVVSGLNAAKITFGLMYGDRIVANSMSVAKLASGTITTAQMTIGAGGVFKIGNPPTDGIFINDQGIRAYKASAQTLAVDVDGTATFSGVVFGATIVSSTISVAQINLDSTGLRINSSETSWDSTRAVRWRYGTSGNDLARIYTVALGTNKGSLQMDVAGSFGQFLGYADKWVFAGGGSSTSSFSGTAGQGSETDTFLVMGRDGTASYCDVSADEHHIWGQTVFHNKAWVPSITTSTAGGDVVRRYPLSGNELYYGTSSESLKANINEDKELADEYLSKLLATSLPVWDAMEASVIEDDPLHGPGPRPPLLTTKRGEPKLVDPNKKPKNRGSAWDRLGPTAERTHQSFAEAVLYNEEGEPGSVDESLVLNTLWYGFQQVVSELKIAGALHANWPKAKKGSK